jgi:hypothetical protein
VTDGRDMNAMMSIIGSQSDRCYCNHPMEVLRVLGKPKTLFLLLGPNLKD